MRRTSLHKFAGKVIPTFLSKYQEALPEHSFSFEPSVASGHQLKISKDGFQEIILINTVRSAISVCKNGITKATIPVNEYNPKELEGTKEVLEYEIEKLIPEVVRAWKDYPDLSLLKEFLQQMGEYQTKIENRSVLIYTKPNDRTYRIGRVNLENDTYQYETDHAWCDPVYEERFIQILGHLSPVILRKNKRKETSELAQPLDTEIELA